MLRALLLVLVFSSSAAAGDDPPPWYQTVADRKMWANWALQQGLIEQKEYGHFSHAVLYADYGNNDYVLHLDFAEDRANILKRIAQITESTPQFGDIHRIPDREVCAWCLSLSAAYLRQLEGLRVWSNHTEKDHIDREISEVKHRRQIYQLMLAVHDNDGWRGTRLLLQDLKDYCGDRMWESGEWVSPVTPSASAITWRDYP